MQVNEINSMMLSIVIVSYNSSQYLRGCLDSLQNGIGTITHEIILVDNASRDESLKLVNSSYPDVLTIQNKTNAGYAAAVNQGMQRSKGNLILLLNPDIVLDSQAIHRCLETFDLSPAVGIAGGTLLHESGKYQQSVFSFPSLTYYFLESFFLYWPYRIVKYLWDREQKECYDVQSIKGAFLMIRRPVIDTIGLFDEDYFMYTEETDFCFRAFRGGWRIVRNPGARVTHFGGRSVGLMPREMFIELHRSKALFFKKHRSRISYLGIRLILGVGVFLRVCLWIFPALILKIAGGKISQNVWNKFDVYVSALVWYLGRSG
jgi:N-acetylglucosaminyl-diphospho-decaprenol L-rhamnosyltransferase